jgi:hypothetical protein
VGDGRTLIAMQVRNWLRWLLLGVLVLFTLAALTWTNYTFAEYNPGGNDFIPRWVGVRLWLEEGQSPYSPETTLAIQEGIYGRPAEPGEDQALFAYPLYAALIFAPFASVEEYILARALWMTLLEISLLATALLGVSLARWKPGRLTLVGFLVFSILWYHGARPLINGNAAILVALFITAGLWQLRAERDSFAGLLFALATIKPQMVLLVVPYILIWAISWRRFALLWSFGLSMLVLLGASFWLQPEWLLMNIAQVLAYSSYTPPGTLATAFATWSPAYGALAGWTLSLVFMLVLFYEWWLSMGKPFDWLLWTASLTIVLSNFVGIPTTTGNYAAMLPIIPLTLSAFSRRLGQERKRFVWSALGLLFAGLWALFLLTLGPTAQYNEHLIMLLPLPILLLLNLYWLRAWMLKYEVSYPAQRAQRRDGHAG